MPDYDVEWERYDATRGGEPRAEAAAEAAAALLPGGLVLDIGGGTGLVARALVAQGRRVVVVDGSAGMLRLARDRLPGSAVRAEAARLPFLDQSSDGVLTMWLLHLLDDVAPVLAEVARVLRPGGVLVTTVDKAAAQGYRDDDPTDRAAVVVAQAAAVGLLVSGRSSYVGVGQGHDDRPDPVYLLLAFRRRLPDATHAPLPQG